MEKENKITKKDDAISLQEIEHAITGDKDEAQAKRYKDAVEAFNVKDLVKVIEIKDEVSGKTAKYELDRGGTRDQKFAMILADKNSSDEKKLSTASLWFFEKGMNNASWQADLMLHKGTQTRELRQFQSTIRFDFTMFVGLFCSFLTDNAKTILESIVPGQEPMTLVKEAVDFLTAEVARYEAKERKERPTLREWAMQKSKGILSRDVTALEASLVPMLLEQGVRYASEAQHMQGEMDKLVQDRERGANKPFPEQR